MNRTGFRQRGFTLVAAIFLLVVIAALGTFAVTLSTTQQKSSALDVLGTRAYLAARAGTEWGAFQITQATAFATNCAGGPQNAVLNALPGTLAGFNVQVSCSAVSHSEGGEPVVVYRLVSTATHGAPATASFVERQVEMSIWR